MRLPSYDICTDRPRYVSQDTPQRVCFDCSQRVKAEVEEENRIILQQCRAIREVLGMRTTDTLELVHGQPTKLYVVQLPRNMPRKHNQVVRMNLDGKIHHAIVPFGLGAGDVFYVRANDGFVGPVRKAPHRTVVYVTQVVVVDDNCLLESLHERALEPAHTEQRTAPTSPVPMATDGQSHDEVQEVMEAAEELPEGEFVECPQCTYRNALRNELCTMCCARLIV